MSARLVVVSSLLLGCASGAASTNESAARSGAAAPTGSGAPGTSGDPVRAGAAAPAAARAEDREAVLAFFSDVGDRAAEGLKKVSDSKPKSRLAYAEALARATPAAMSLNADLMEQRGLTRERFASAMSDPAVEKQAMAGLQAKLEPLLKQLAELPEAHADDCTALGRRLVELVGLGPSHKPLLSVMGVSLQRCVGVAPEALFRCLPAPGTPGTVADFDACIAQR